jgi:large subunit ribosomal protein L28
MRAFSLDALSGDGKPFPLHRLLSWQYTGFKQFMQAISLAFHQELCYDASAVKNELSFRACALCEGREVYQVGKYCEVCEKGTMNGHKVSHSNRKSNKLWAPNIQNVRVVINGAPKRIGVCTRCLRSGNVVRALPKITAETVEA